MKAYIGPYISWFGPYQLAEKLMFWTNRYEDERVHALGKWLAGDEKDTWLYKVMQWVHNKRSRTVYIKTDKYDSWNADHTIALLVLPILKDLRKNTHSSGFIDFEDLPEHLRFGQYEDWECGQRCFDFYIEDQRFLTSDRWNWMLDEIIWSFEQMTTDGSDDQFYDRSEVDRTGNVMQQVKQTKIDWEGLKKHNERIQNGCRLFGKYFQSLWD